MRVGRCLGRSTVSEFRGGGEGIPTQAIHSKTPSPSAGHLRQTSSATPTRATMDLNVALMRTAVAHFLENSPLVEKGTDKYALMEELQYALDRYFEENAVALQIADPHELHAALEMEGYQLMYSGVTQSFLGDAGKTGLVVKGFSLNIVDEEEEDDEEDDDDEDTDEEEEDDEDTDEEEEETDEDEEETDEEEDEDEDDIAVLRKLVESGEGEEGEGEDDDEEEEEEEEEKPRKKKKQSSASSSSRHHKRSHRSKRR
jgi:hypothetical protein